MVPARSLRIAWLGLTPLETGGAPGAATDLLQGLGALGHRIDCFLPGDGHKQPARLGENQNIGFVWKASYWHWNRWYSRAKAAAFLTGLLARGLVSLQLRREVTRRHRQEPYDVLLQASSLESLSVPSRLTPTVPLVIFPQTHAAGELRGLIAERRLSVRCQPRYIFVLVAVMMFLRALVQRSAIRRASLLVCISSVFRDHLIHDYRFPKEATVVIPNPVRLDRFVPADRQLNAPPTVLVLGRIAVRKGIDDVVALARKLAQRGADVRFRIVGGPSLWSDYTKLLEDLPQENSDYGGRIPPAQIPQELARSDILLQASKYEPFGLTVAEALAAGVPVVATTEVGAIEGVDRSVVGVVRPGDVEGMAEAVTEMLDRVRRSPVETSAIARAEATRLFAPEVVCEQLSLALGRLIDGAVPDRASAG
jgi:glycosyltransferase involved in cell wall biosynthesis